MRYRPYLLLAVLVLGSGLGIGVGLAGAPQAVPAAATRGRVVPPHVNLPSADDFQQLSIEKGRLIVTGQVASTINQTFPRCVTAPVDVRRMRVGPVTQSNCGDELALG